MTSFSSEHSTVYIAEDDANYTTLSSVTNTTSSTPPVMAPNQQPNYGVSTMPFDPQTSGRSHMQAQHTYNQPVTQPLVQHQAPITSSHVYHNMSPNTSTHPECPPWAYQLMQQVNNLQQSVNVSARETSTKLDNLGRSVEEIRTEMSNLTDRVSRVESSVSDLQTIPTRVDE